MEPLLLSDDLIFWTSITLICTVPSIAICWCRARKAEIEASLKHEMLQRGMSADDIATVLEASSRRHRLVMR